MVNANFRTAVTANPEQYAEPKPMGKLTTTEQTTVETPFTEYRNVNKLPFTADYIDAKLTWEEAGMVDDVTRIEDYLTDLVSKGELENSIKSAKEQLIKLERMAGIDKLESKAQRLIKLSEFVNYLKRLEERTQHGW